MKKFMTTAAILAAMTLPVFAQAGEDKAGEAKGALKATTDMNKATTDMKKDTGSSAMGQGALPQGAAIRPSTTGAAGAASDNQLNKEENSSVNNPGQKTGVSSGGGGNQ